MQQNAQGAHILCSLGKLHRTALQKGFDFGQPRRKFVPVGGYTPYRLCEKGVHTEVRPLRKSAT